MMRRRVSQDSGVVVEEVEVTCAFCRGRGTDPFAIMSSRSTCCVCGGSGKVRVSRASLSCAHCRGTGAIQTLTCTTCGGKGAIPRPPGPTVPCPVCHGSGDDASAPAMACLKCRGSGCVTRGGSREC